METLSVILLLCLVVYAISAWLEGRRNAHTGAVLLEALQIVDGLAKAISHASKEHPMLIASAKDAKEIADKLSRVYRGEGGDSSKVDIKIGKDEDNNG